MKISKLGEFGLIDRIAKKPKDKNMNKLLRDFDLEIGFDGSGKAVSEEIRYK